MRVFWQIIVIFFKWYSIFSHYLLIVCQVFIITDRKKDSAYTRNPCTQNDIKQWWETPVCSYLYSISIFIISFAQYICVFLISKVLTNQNLLVYFLSALFILSISFMLGLFDLELSIARQGKIWQLLVLQL